MSKQFLKERRLVYHLLVSFLVILTWVLLARSRYSYNHNFPHLFGISLFPLVPAAIILFIVYVVYAWMEGKFENRSIIKGFLFFTLLSWVVLIVGETVGYHWFGIHNIGTAEYAPLPICNCIHAPVWMQISYFAMPPIYFLICSALGLENMKIREH